MRNFGHVYMQVFCLKTKVRLADNLTLKQRKQFYREKNSLEQEALMLAVSGYSIWLSK